jgi:hypothetical protein
LAREERKAPNEREHDALTNARKVSPLKKWHRRRRRRRRRRPLVVVVVRLSSHPRREEEEARIMATRFSREWRKRKVRSVCFWNLKTRVFCFSLKRFTRRRRRRLSRPVMNANANTDKTARV